MTLPRLVRSKFWVRAILVALVVVAGLRIGFSFLVQPETVERGLEQALENWTGAQVHIGKETHFSFWPYPRVTLRDVRVVPDGSGELISAETVSATFDLFGAVRGHPSFSDFELVRPIVRLRRQADGTFNWRHSGWLVQAIDATKAAEGKPTSEPSDERIGTITLVDGVLEIVSGESRPYRISDIDGTVTWPTLRQRLTLALSGVSNGEMTRLSFDADQPLALLAGRDATVRTSLSADPGAVRFEGAANLSGSGFVNGTVQLSTPSLSRLLAWQGRDIPAVSTIGEMTVEANIATSGYAARLENVKLALDGTKATGVLDLNMPPQSVPRIGGTLAFDRIDLRAFLSAFSPLPGADQNAPTIDTTFIHQFGMDLRLSAGTATFSPFALKDLAAGMRIENGRASFDIGDSTLLDGRLTGRIAVAEEGFRGGGKLQFSLSNVDMGSIASTLALPGPLPSGIGSADFELSTKLPLWATTPSDMSGKFRLRLGSGTLTHFNRQAFEKLAAQGNFFSMSAAGDGSFAFNRADVEARLDRGLAELTKAEIESNDALLTLSGMVPYRTGSLALAGLLKDRTAADATNGKPGLSFFVGGSWPDPVISPASVLTGRQPRQ
ncbi:AsmA family protein [Shinella sumterensis]|uniref:AsmA-like C-terminal region-containing protein n=1 Tax=Shinella sumterensis TaxID=1967501 RepID=A0AA50H4P5_9HYPH|nr:AsmA-like C-terminal region-containing protein [Shinella sumterensis]WLR96438.1 AsmA-like C-terminal region-containing protein [Shinella sumterensis]